MGDSLRERDGKVFEASSACQFGGQAVAALQRGGRGGSEQQTVLSAAQRRSFISWVGQVRYIDKTVTGSEEGVPSGVSVSVQGEQELAVSEETMSSGQHGAVAARAAAEIVWKKHTKLCVATRWWLA